MKPSLMFAWIGSQDLAAARDELNDALGPIGAAVTQMVFTELHLLSDWADVGNYVEWLEALTDAEIVLHKTSLSGPTHHGDIYHGAVQVLERVVPAAGSDAEVTYHLSPGTPAMAAVWLLLAKTSHPAQLIESSREAGVQLVDIPFELAADFIPPHDRRLEDLAAGLPPAGAAFADIIHRSDVMKQLLQKAQRVAHFDVSVLITGESGTGKELLARAVHSAGPRHAEPFVAVNCGAIPRELVESELFGHVKGAFTGAVADHVGHIEAAAGGTLFLDEVGELPAAAQVKLLRVLQERRVRRVGDTKERHVDFRVIAATNRNLIEAIGDGTFREDLFHRLAVGILPLPPLRERHNDLPLLTKHLVALVNEELSSNKNLSVGAKNIISQHPWPGNVRELWHTLLRAALWAADDTITKAELQAALLPLPRAIKDAVLDRRLGDGFDVDNVLAEVARHYLERAMTETRNNKSRAARLLGLGSYQTLTNWLERYGVGEGVIEK